LPTVLIGTFAHQELAGAGQDEWSTRVNQALRFDSNVAVEHVAASLASNSAAKEYLAVKL
jgi:hypothetical protein